nr:integrase, catalytic region, zinc finger, CCHC-type, peptidase aspartic, catalytic [Tanacetum cinerariifolium]
RNANPLSLVATAQANQDPYYQTSRSHKSHAPSSKPSIPTKSHTTTRHKGNEIAKPITPPSETTSEEDSDPEQAQRDKDMQKNLALIAKYFKKIYKPTNNNLITSSNLRNKNVDTTSRYKKDDHSGQFGNQRMVNIAGAREKVGSIDSEPVEHVQYEAGYSVFANDLQHSEQSKSVSNTCLVETDDSNVIPDSPDMCEYDIQNDQNDVESDDERVALANLIANLKLDVDENKMIQKQLKKANTTLSQELKECKTILAETKIAKPITPPSETTSEEDSDPEQAQRDKDTQKNLALIAKYFKKIYKPTNNNLRTSSNSKNKNVDKTPWFKNDSQFGQFGNQRTMNFFGAREKVGSPVVQQSGIQYFNCREFGHFAKECRKLKRVKDSVYHKEKMLLCKQAEQATWLRFRRFLQQIQAPILSQWNSNTCLVETDDSNAIPDSPDMYEDDIHNDQNNVESDSILVETSKSLRESISVRDSCLVVLQTKQTEFEKYKEFNDRTIDYDKLERKLNEALGQLAQKDIVIKEGLKTKAYELFVVKEKHDELINQSLLTKSHYESLVKQKTKVITDLKLREEHDIEKMLSMEKQLKFLNEVVYKRSQSIQTVHMMAPKVSTYNGRPTFANPRLIPDGEETLALERESRSKLNKDLVHALDELQCVYLHKVKECDCLKQKLSKQTESVSKKVHTELLQRFAKVEKHSISLEIALQKCKEQKLIEKGKGKSVDTKFDRPSIVRQPNAQRIPKPSVLVKPALFSNSLERIYFPKTKSVPKANVSEGLSKPVTTQTLPQTAKQAIVQLILFIVDSGCTKHMTGNLKLLCNFVEKFLGTIRFGNDHFAPILGYGYLVAFKKSTCFVRDLQGNDLLTDNRRSDLYMISLQESTSSTPLYLMAKATPTQAWLWHQRLSHLNFDYINLL